MNGLNLVKYDETNRAGDPSGNVQTMEAFNGLLNQPPPDDEIQVNKMAANSRYLPVSFVQMKLDEFFVGMWETKDFKSTVIANEIVGSITLRYFHPFAKSWIERTGSAAVMIQQASGADITDISKKHKNTLGKDYPHLLASCLTSAAKTIGKVFGRDLNRKFEDNAENFYTDIASAEAVTGGIAWDTITTVKELTAIWNKYPDLHDNKNFKKTFGYHRDRIKTKVVGNG